MFRYSYEDKQRITAMIILVISFAFPIPLLGIISGIHLLRQVNRNLLPSGFRVAGILLILEQTVIYVPMLAYLWIVG
ncbi:hypothetical protein NRIC_27860 [Enterococcus florum]|uniref:Uncharacterized protein n=1 Tax=Enterococcus florum TaxID=2480627 RepID=A0A4P5P9W8_9ENTE|nr:hypothetical protein [Enterococcus florum]GCF94895.1 hypothetical protein NRIC_27860 [Enterococcus florum]